MSERPNYWTVAGIVVGLSLGIVGTNVEATKPKLSPPADCAERMNAAAKACDALPGGFVEFRDGTIVCRNTNPTVTELRP